jgi:hypothetical protein
VDRVDGAVTSSFALTQASPVDRRRFLVGGGLAMVSVLLTRPDVAITRTLENVHLSRFGDAAPQTLALSTFTPHVGSTFLVTAGAFEVVALKLVDAAAPPVRKAQNPRVTGEAFSLHFEGSTEALLTDGVHTLRHASLSPLALFLAPVGRGLKVQDYQTVIDHRSFKSGTSPKKAG